MTRIAALNRSSWLFVLLGSTIVAGCEGPTWPAADVDAPGMAVYQSKNVDKATGLQPADPPTCPETLADGRKLCKAEVNAKHGNNQGLPVNLNGVLSGNQKSGSGASLMVTVLGTLEFNLAAVDLNTVKAGDVANDRIPLTPITLLSNGKHQASIVDVNGDGILDLVLHFNIPAMVANGDLSATTTELCIYGEGPQYVINGCGAGGGDGDGNGDGGGDDEPPPSYRDLEDCGDDVQFSVRPGKRCAVIQKFGRDLVDINLPSMPWVKQNPAWTWDPNLYLGYTNWTTVPLAELETSQSLPGPTQWEQAVLPLGSENRDSHLGHLTKCNLVGPSEYKWYQFLHLLLRTDLHIPKEAENVTIEFIVDDQSLVFWNGQQLTKDWVVGQAITVVDEQAGTETTGCRSYTASSRVSVPKNVLLAGGWNMIGIWAADPGGYVNYLDFRVFAEVPIS